MLLKKPWNDNPFDQFEEEFTPRWICFGKGGGSAPPPQPTQSTVTQTNLPDYAEPFFTRLLERTEAETNEPYTPYGGSRVADFSPETLESFDQIREIGTSGIPEQIGEASNIASAVGNYQPSVPFQSAFRGSVQPFESASRGAVQPFQTTWRGSVSPFYTPSAISQAYPGGPSMTEAYMNPYVNQVLNRGQERALQRFDEQQLDRNADFVRRGAFSNSRRDVASEMARSDLNEQLLDIEAKGLANAFDTAQGMFTSDAQRKLMAQIESERAAQSSYTSDADRYLRGQIASEEAAQSAFASDADRYLRSQIAGEEAAQSAFASDADRYLRAQTDSERAALSAAQMRLAASDQLAQYGGMEQNAWLQQADALAKIGALREERGQSGLDVAYTDFINQRDYPRQQLNFYSGILNRTPTTPQSEVVRYETPPSPLSQALGLGLGGLSLYRQFTSPTGG